MLYWRRALFVHLILSLFALLVGSIVGGRHCGWPGWAFLPAGFLSGSLLVISGGIIAQHKERFGNNDIVMASLNMYLVAAFAFTLAHTGVTPLCELPENYGALAKTLAANSAALLVLAVGWGARTM